MAGIEQIERVMRLHREGFERSQIAEMVGCHIRTVGKYLRTARDHKLFVRIDPLFLQLEKHVPKEITDWLVDATPEGAKIGDTLRSILQDAYDDEH